MGTTRNIITTGKRWRCGNVGVIEEGFDEHNQETRFILWVDGKLMGEYARVSDAKRASRHWGASGEWRGPEIYQDPRTRHVFV